MISNVPCQIRICHENLISKSRFHLAATLAEELGDHFRSFGVNWISILLIKRLQNQYSTTFCNIVPFMTILVKSFLIILQLESPADEADGERFSLRSEEVKRNQDALVSATRSKPARIVKQHRLARFFGLCGFLNHICFTSRSSWPISSVINLRKQNYFQGYLDH